MDILTALSAFLKPLLEAYGGQYGWAVAAVAYIGSFRVFFKPIMAAIEASVKESASTKDDEILNKVEGNVIYKAFVFLVDLFASVKIKPKSVSSK